MIRLAGLQSFLCCFALALSACGGGSSPSPDPGAPASAPLTGAVTIRVADQSGTAIPGVGISLNGGFSGRSDVTNAEGVVRFSGLPAGEASVGTFAGGYHRSYRRFVINGDRTTELSMALLRSAQAIPVVLAVHAVPSDNGRTLTVDLDVAVLGEDGVALPTLTAAEFRADGSECLWWGPCVESTNGGSLPNSNFSANVDSGHFTWHEVSTGPAPASAIALLLEQSRYTMQFDPLKRRIAATHAFLGWVTMPDTVAVASYHDALQGPVATFHGPFTSDGASFQPAIDALPDHYNDPNPALRAVGEMLDWTAGRPADETTGQRSLVLLSGNSVPDDCGEFDNCLGSLRIAISEASRNANIPIVAIGGSNQMAYLAARTGGAFVATADPEQYAVVLRNLKSIVSQRISFNRVRLVLSATESLFQSGRSVWPYAEVRIGTDTSLEIPLVIPIP